MQSSMKVPKTPSQSQASSRNKSESVNELKLVECGMMELRGIGFELRLISEEFRRRTRMKPLSTPSQRAEDCLNRLATVISLSLPPIVGTLQRLVRSLRVLLYRLPQQQQQLLNIGLCI